MQMAPDSEHSKRKQVIQDEETEEAITENLKRKSIPVLTKVKEEEPHDHELNGFHRFQKEAKVKEEEHDGDFKPGFRIELKSDSVRALRNAFRSVRNSAEISQCHLQGSVTGLKIQVENQIGLVKAGLMIRAAACSAFNCSQQSSMLLIDFEKLYQTMCNTPLQNEQAREETLRVIFVDEKLPIIVQSDGIEAKIQAIVVENIGGMNPVEKALTMEGFRVVNIPICLLKNVLEIIADTVVLNQQQRVDELAIEIKITSQKLKISVGCVEMEINYKDGEGPYLLDLDPTKYNYRILFPLSMINLYIEASGTADEELKESNAKLHLHDQYGSVLQFVNHIGFYFVDLQFVW